MRLKGSCHCQAVRFSVESHEPVPFMRCYCSICRKTAGSGGFAINLGADFSTLKVKGREHVGIYRARLGRTKRSPGERHFCRLCGSPLWVWDPRWPELVHPHAGAIDTPLPEPTAVTHMMLGSRAPWVAVPRRRGDSHFETYPKLSLAQWHEKHGQTR
jgi:hypothetical protein